MTRLTGHCTVSWQDVVVDTVHKDRPFTVFQLAVHTCGYGRQCARRQSLYIGLDINIYTGYVIENLVANFVPPPTLHHLTTAVTLIIISYPRQTGVCDGAN
jgi:hypothetical protein